MKVMMTGGGTGGHINPALAIANTIREKNPDTEFLFVGTEKGMENRLVPKEGYELAHIEIQGLRRSLSPANIKTAWLTITSVPKAKKLIKSFKPDLVVGTGGYVCYPLCRAAAALHIPVVVHESNAVPGLAVKMLAPYVDVIFTNFKAAEEHIKEKYRDKIKRVGNPYKRTGEAYTKERARDELGLSHKYRYSILVYGGSLGAGTINRAAAEYAGKYMRNDTLLTHAAGVAHYEEVKEMYGQNGNVNSNCEILDYIYDMPRRQAASDIIICRSGAMTTSELAEGGCCAILVPSPNVTDDQQYKNAKALSDEGAAVLLPDDQCTGESLNKIIEDLLGDKNKRDEMSENIKKFACPDANETIYTELMKLAGKRRR